MMKFSIIIPTFNKKELLVDAINSIKEYTDLSNGEVIVVSNGCLDGTQEYVKLLGNSFKLIEFPDAIGYTKATNEGIKIAKGEYLIFFNNDNQLLPQSKNEWLKFLIEPFLNNSKMGITGPLQLHDDYSDNDVIIGFCLCIHRKVLNECMKDGLLDEIYSPGGGEDIDLCCNVRNKGYIVRQVPNEGKLGYSHTNTGRFQIWHKNNQTFKHIDEYTNWYVKRNGLYNVKRFNKNIRLNIGSGGIEYAGYLSVDLHDRRASIIMDITKLDFDDNSVSELLAIHVFEHLNPYKSMNTLREWYRVLKPGGRLIMEMPDIQELCKQFTASIDRDKRYGILNAIYGSVNTTDVGDHTGDNTNITSPHLFGWYRGNLEEHLIDAGFKNISFGSEQYPHPPFPEANFHVEVTKPGSVEGVDKSMMYLWNFGGVDAPFSYGGDDSYRKAGEFLSDCTVVEDWGGGTGYFKKFVSNKYVNVDGSRSKWCDVLADLQSYKSNADGILIRHILEHNHNWKQILSNALASFKEKLVLIIFTPFNSNRTEQIAVNWSAIPDISFKQSDIDELLPKSYTFETVHSSTQYGIEHIYYITK